jgi:hypothetical protein
LEAVLAKFNLKEYARSGAAARVAELNAELQEIYRAFPDMRATRGRRIANKSNASASRGHRRRRKPMSAAQKKAVSARMKKYWAERRKAKPK